MELKDFIKEYLQHSTLGVSEIVTKASRDFAWAFENDPQCRSWYITQRLKELDVEPDRFCCLELALWNLEDLTQTRYNTQGSSPEKFVIYWNDFRAYGIRHSSGTYYVPLNCCPWCGNKLPEFDWFKQYRE
jgi:hypothetical protein